MNKLWIWIRHYEYLISTIQYLPCMNLFPSIWQESSSAAFSNDKEWLWLPLFFFLSYLQCNWQLHLTNILLSWSKLSIGVVSLKVLSWNPILTKTTVRFKGIPWLSQASLVASDGKLSASNPGSIPGLGRSLKKETATHSSILAWKIPWTEDPGRLQSMGSQGVGHNWETSLSFFLL